MAFWTWDSSAKLRWSLGYFSHYWGASVGCSPEMCISLQHQRNIMQQKSEPSLSIVVLVDLPSHTIVDQALFQPSWFDIKSQTFRGVRPTSSVNSSLHPADIFFLVTKGKQGEIQFCPYTWLITPHQIQDKSSKHYESVMSISGSDQGMAQHNRIYLPL